MKTYFFLCILSLLSLSNALSFNMSSCPAYYELQSESVARNFDIAKFPGTYYEVLFHDYTQFPTCLSLSCVRSQKAMVHLDDNQAQIVDTFTIGCFGAPFSLPLYFNATSNNGYFEGYLKNAPTWWKILEPGEFYPDTIVDFEEDPQDPGQYKWVIEFQCKEATVLGHKFVSFTGINFYSKYYQVDENYLNNMVTRARAAGLGVYLDAGVGIRKMDFSNCTNVWKESATE